MSHIAQRALRQDATLWQVTPDSHGGDLFGDPIPVKCRWEEKTEQFQSTLDNDEHTSRAIVFLDRTAQVGDYLALGTFDEADPTELVAWKIQRFDTIPNLRNLLMMRKAYL